MKKKPPRRSASMQSEREFRGCMSTIMHLFDFNRTLTTRKILPAQTFSGELEAPRRSSEIPGRETKYESAKEEKKKNPNVVARLMGLDAMPVKSTSGDHSRSSSVNSNQISIDKEKQTYPITLPKSRSVSEAYSPLPYNIANVTQKLDSRSHSFREHPQEKQLEEFKRDFEARQSLQYSEHSHYFQHKNFKFEHNNVQQRLDAPGLLYRDNFIESPRTPASGRKMYTQSTEFLDALEYLQKNEEILLKTHSDSSPLFTKNINPPHYGVANKTYAQERAPRPNTTPRPNIKELKGSRSLLPLHSRSSSPSRNSASILPATIVVLKPNSGTTTRTTEKLKNYKGESEQSSKDTSTEFRKTRDIPQCKEGKNNGTPVSKAFKESDLEDDSASISSSRRKSLQKITTSNRSMSANGDEASSALSKPSSQSGKSNAVLQSSPRFGKRMVESSKEEKKVAAKKDVQCLRSEVKKVSSRSHSISRPNRDVHDRSASSAGCGRSNNSTTDSAKKKPDPQDLMSKRKMQSKKNTMSLTQSKERTAGLGGKGENSQRVIANALAIGSEDKIECPIDSGVDGACKQPSVDEKNEFPSPNSVLDGTFQQESPSPLDTKEATTDFHELRKKLCSLKSDGNDTSDSDQSGHVCHEDEMSKSIPEVGVLAGRTELSSDKSMDLYEMQRSSFESLDVEGIACSKGKEASLLYVRNLLVSAGFNNDNILETTEWCYPSNPIDPQVFYQLEDYYNNAQENNPCMETSNGSQGCEKSKLALDVVNRKLLFEIVNEILGKKLKPFLDTRHWIKPAKLNCLYMSTGKRLLQEVWDKISSSPEVDCKILEDVEALISKDMRSEAPWAPDSEDIEKVGAEVEQLIFDNLLEEFVFDLLSR